jgi:hypothetical protein
VCRPSLGRSVSGLLPVKPRSRNCSAVTVIKVTNSGLFTRCDHFVVKDHQVFSLALTADAGLMAVKILPLQEVVRGQVEISGGGCQLATSAQSQTCIRRAQATPGLKFRLYSNLRDDSSSSCYLGSHNVD